jgi:hypothetical protein
LLQAQKHSNDSQPEVTVFLACECPISQKYVPLLNSIYSRYKEFKWSFVVPGKVSKSDISGFAKEFDVRFPLTVDRKGSTVNRLHAGTTPQVIIVRDSVVYTGAIDNWFYELGKYRREATEHYLVDALEAIRQGNNPVVRETEAIGCPIAISH